MKKTRAVFLLVSVVLVCTHSWAQSGLHTFQKLPPPPQTQTHQGLAQGSAAPSVILTNINTFLTKIGHPSPALQAAHTGMRSASAPIAGISAWSMPGAPNPSGTIGAIVRNANAGTPRLIDMQPSAGARSHAALSAATAEVAARTFLATNAALLQLHDPAAELQLKSTTTDVLHSTHCRFTQMYKGIEVWGREFIVHFDANGTLVSANGTIEKTPVGIQDATGTVSDAAAIQIAASAIAASKPLMPVPALAARLLEYSGQSARTIIWHDAFHVPHLAWVVETRSGLSEDWFTFVDAHSGAILNSYNAVCYDGIASATAPDLNGVQRTFKTYQVGSTYFLLDASQQMFDAANSKIPDSPVGAIVGLDLRNADLTSTSSIYYVTSPNNTWSDKSSVSAHYNASVVYNYYLGTYGRNSVDDKGMTIYSIIHVTDQGKPMENAYWSGKIMCYGDGATYFYPLAGGLDVAAHEMTHGVTQFSANLEYQGQSGALNESMSDAFGTLVDTLNWKIGETIVRNLQAFPTGALRDMVDPHNGGSKGQQSWQPATMSEFVTTTDDNGGVHINSGIPNHAFFLTASAVGRQKAGKIWYRALTTYLTRSSQFIDARIATVKAAGDLYGSTGSETASVKNAWDAVGVLDAAPTPVPPPSVLTGNEWVLMVNTDPADANSIYMVKSAAASNADYHPLTTTAVLNRPAVSDVSGLILFVDAQHNLRAMNADPANPQETVIDDSGVWESVSVGPGLGSLALTSKYIDTTIYYIDLVKSTSTPFKIATKTFDATDKKTALYADALSFDPTGRYVLFDAYNELKNASGSTISFWNINILDVTTGAMGVIFPPLADGLSVGNPSYSKTSGTRFAFDYLDGTTGQTYVMAADFNTGAVGTITGPQSVIGYPTYSADDKTIAYHSSELVAGVSHHTIEQMALKSSLIEGTGVKVPYATDATFPTWFIIGTRTTTVTAADDAAPAAFALLQNYPNPFNPSTTIRYALPHEGRVRVAVYDMLGSRIATLIDGTERAGDHELIWNATDDGGRKVTSGVYLLVIDAGARVQTRKMVLLK